MIDMRERQIAMQRRVNRGGARIEVEGAVGKIAYHLILMGEAAIELFQAEKLAEIERGEAVELHRAQIAARALDPEHLDFFSAERIALAELGRRIAATKIGHREIGAKQMGPVEQQLRGRQRRGIGVRPAICGTLKKQGRRSPRLGNIKNIAHFEYLTDEGIWGSA